MRSRWSAEAGLTWLAVTSMEGAWLTLLYIAAQRATGQRGVPLNVLHFSLAVAAGMLVARLARNSSQTRYAAAMATAAVTAAVVGALLSGLYTIGPADFLRTALVAPATWLIGLAVVRGAVQSDPRSGYETERVFRLGIPALVGFWLLASSTAFARTEGLLGASFAATLTFISAGLLALGLSRLDDLEVEAVDQAARRRWLVLLVSIVFVVLLVGIPLSALLGVPVSAAVAGVLGPLAPVLIAIFSIMSIPVFWLLDALTHTLGAPVRPGPTIAVPSAIGNGPPPLFEPGSGQAPELSWLLLVVVVVGIIVLVRVLSIVLRQPALKRATESAAEIRVAEQISLPPLPRIGRPRFLPVRRGKPHNASEAYRFSLAALDGGALERHDAETPRQHAARIQASNVAREVAWLATDYELDEFASKQLTAKEHRRALARWRRVVTATRRRIA